MTKDEAFKEYEETLDKLNKEHNRAREEARTTLQERLKTLREKAHDDLKVIRALTQKTKRRQPK